MYSTGGADIGAGPRAGRGVITALPPLPLAPTGSALSLIPGAPELVERREGKAMVGLSRRPRGMPELQLSAGPFWCYPCEHLNNPSLTKLARSLGGRAGAELPWQALRMVRHQLGKATQRLYQTFWLRWRLLFQPISARDMGRARPRRSLQQLQGELCTLSQLTCGAQPWEITLSEPPQPCSLPPSQDAGDPQPTCLLSRSLTTLPTPERWTRD